MVLIDAVGARSTSISGVACASVLLISVNVALPKTAPLGAPSRLGAPARFFSRPTGAVCSAYVPCARYRWRGFIHEFDRNQTG